MIQNNTLTLTPIVPVTLPVKDNSSTLTEGLQQEQPTQVSSRLSNSDLKLPPKINVIENHSDLSLEVPQQENSPEEHQQENEVSNLDEIHPMDLYRPGAGAQGRPEDRDARFAGWGIAIPATGFFTMLGLIGVTIWSVITSQKNV